MQVLAQSFALLFKAGFVVKDAKGRYRAADPVIDSGDATFTQEQMQKHHGETLGVWAKNLNRLNSKQQELGLLHIPIASEKIPELRARMRRFQDEIIGWLEAETQPDQLVQLGTYLMPFPGREGQ